MFKLCDEDARVVDALLDQHQQTHPIGTPGNSKRDIPTLPTQLQPRLQRFQHLLGLLNAIPVCDPPQDLVARTLQAVGQSADDQRPAPWPFAMTNDPSNDIRPGY